MNIMHGNGPTKYGPGVNIELDGDEVAIAISAWLVAKGVNISGPRTIRVNGELCGSGRIYVDPSGWVEAPAGKFISGRGRIPHMIDEVFTFFWNGPFSQWHPSVFVVDGFTYNCAEQFMMAEKARLFHDSMTLGKIMCEDRPREQKALGRRVEGFNPELWEGVARDVVYRGNYAKFSQNPHLKDCLMATGGTTLVEASPYDTIWGIGLEVGDVRANSRSTWLGTNWLGEVLTKLREDLRHD